MKKIITLALACILPNLVFGDAFLVRIGGELLTRGGLSLSDATLKGVESSIATGIRVGTLSQMEIPFENSYLQDAIKSAITPTLEEGMLSSLAQDISAAVLAAQEANEVLFNIAPVQSGYAMDSYPPKLLTQIQELAQIGADELPLPLSTEEVNLLLASDTQGNFFDRDFEPDGGFRVASFRQPMHIQMRTGYPMYNVGTGQIWKVSEKDYAALEKHFQDMSQAEIKALEDRAQVSYFRDAKKHLTYNEFRGLVSTGDPEFFGDPFLALVERQRMDDTVGVFFQVKKNLVVSSGSSFYSLPANSYVCICEFNGGIDKSHFLFDAKPSMRALTPEMTAKLQQVLKDTPSIGSRSIRVMTEMDDMNP